MNNGLMQPKWPFNAPKRTMPPNPGATFDGEDDWVKVRHSKSLNPLDRGIRVEAVLTPAEVGERMGVYSDYGEEMVNMVNLYLHEDGTFKAEIRDSEEDMAVATSTPIKPGVEHEVVLNWDSEEKTVGLTVDGETWTDTNPRVGTIDTSGMYVSAGGMPWWEQFFDGTIKLLKVIKP